MFEKQLEAFNKFSKLKVGALFMQMGTGKTKIAVELVNYNKVDLLVFLCPFSSKENIETELIKWGVNCDYIIVGYETIQSSDKKYLEVLEKVQDKKCFIVADESIFLKNFQTKRFQRVCKIRENCEYALVLNGTPLTKNEWDLYNQMEFLSPKIIGMNRNQFQATFFKEIKFKKRGQREKTYYKFSEVNAEYLSELVKPYIFNADLDFDKKETNDYNYVDINLDEYEQEKYDFFAEMMSYEKEDSIIALLQALNKISACDKMKNNKVAEYIENKRVIVFCNYLDELNYIAGEIDCYTITGAVKNRAEIIEKFKNDTKPLLITFGCGSFSLNLQFCNEIVYSSLNFDYGLIEQSKFRIKRIGQDSNIKYTYILANCGITKMIEQNLDKKVNLKNLIKEKIAKGEAKEWVKSI